MVDDAGVTDVDVVTATPTEAPHDIDGVSVPPPPGHLAEELDASLRDKLHLLFYTGTDQLSSVYRAMVEHPGAGPTALLPHTACANAGAVNNRKVIVLAVLEGTTPRAASVALQASRTVSTLIRRSADEEVKRYLDQVLRRLQARALSEEAVEDETADLESQSSDLEQILRDSSGIYVYTYPHYWRNPYVAGTERRMLKVGRTSDRAWNRVVSQARQTGMPEDPLLLRVYVTDEPVVAERTFHMLLDAAEHDRSGGVATGREWFVTTIEFCDAIAVALDLEQRHGRTSGGA